jgi:hypothetical protein
MNAGPAKPVAAGLILTKLFYDSYSTAKDIKDIVCYSYRHKYLLFNR